MLDSKNHLTLKYYNSNDHNSHVDSYNLFVELYNLNPDDGDVLFLIGDSYLKGKGVEQNVDKALYWFKLGALANDTDSCLELSKGSTGKVHVHYIEKAIRISLDPTSSESQRAPATIEYTLSDGSLASQILVDFSLLQHYVQKIDALENKISEYEKKLPTCENKVSLITTQSSSMEIPHLSLPPIYTTTTTTLPKKKSKLRTVWNWITWK